MTWIIAITIFLADFFVKNYLKNNFAFQTIPLIKNILHITVIFNQGAAFGILKGHANLLLWVSVVFIILLIIMRKKSKRSAYENILFGLIIGGAISNLWDRIAYGYVIDYINIQIWPIFNLSDMCISAGVIGLIIRSFRKGEKNFICI